MTRELDLTGFHPSFKDLIASAIDLGWNPMQATRASNNHATVVLHSYDNSQSIRVTPVRQVNEAKLRTMRAKVVRYAEPMKRLNVVATLGQADERGAPPEEGVRAAMPTLDASVTTDTVRVPDPTLVEERPWLARKSASKRGGKVYESAAVTERRWSDGSVDYVCAFPGCGWTNGRARSVSTHYGAAHTLKGDATSQPQAPTYPAGDYFEPLTHRAYRPQERLVQALMAYLMEQGDMGGLRETAEAMLTWAHERPDLPDVEPESRGPLTPEQILEAVRELVGAPLASRLVQAQEEAQGLAESIADLTAQVLTRDALIERLRDERRTLADLLAEEQS